jgi:hypothetical protein
VQFQEFQCWFVISCQIAAITARVKVEGNPHWLEAYTMTELTLDFELFRGVPIGAFPVTLVLIGQRLNAVASTFLCVLTALVIRGSIAVTAAVPSNIPLAALTPIPGQEKLDKRGGHGQPVVMCKTGNPLGTGTILIIVVLFWVLCIFCLLLFIAMPLRLYSELWSDHRAIATQHAADNTRRRQHWIWQVAALLIPAPLVLILGMLGLYAWELEIVAELGAFSKGVWNFGQLVAITSCLYLVAKLSCWCICMLYLSLLRYNG